MKRIINGLLVLMVIILCSKVSYSQNVVKLINCKHSNIPNVWFEEISSYSCPI